LVTIESEILIVALSCPSSIISVIFSWPC